MSGSLVQTVAAQGASASLTFKSVPTKVSVGSVLQLQLVLDPQGNAVNAINVVATASEDTFSFVGVSGLSSSFQSIIPSSPASKNGKVNFALADLGSSVSSQTALVTLNYKVKAASSNATVSLEGSMAANAGSDVATTTDIATVNIAGTSASNDVQADVSGVHLESYRQNGATLVWQTAEDTTATVNFGLTSSYGFVATDATPGKPHSVPLVANFAPYSLVHYQLVVTTADGSTSKQPDHVFRTQGYPVQITVENKDHKALSGVTVSINGSATQKTNSSGVASFASVGPGSQKVSLDGSTQLITVRDTSTAKLQDFRLVKHTTVPGAMLAEAVGALLALLILFALWRSYEMRSHRRAS